MTDEEIVSRLTCLWSQEADRQATEAEASLFLAMYREMQSIDREVAEEERVAHARWLNNRNRP